MISPNTNLHKAAFCRSDIEAHARFMQLLDQWRSETTGESNVARLIRHPAYLRIIAIGPQAVPFILQELATRNHLVWLQALEDITGENPIPAEHEVDGKLMIADWIAWGRGRGII